MLKNFVLTSLLTHGIAAMAQTVMAARQPGKTVLLIAGGGHVDRALGVPTHLPENTSSKVVLALASYARVATNSGVTLHF